MQRLIKFRAWDTKELRWLDQKNPHDFIIMPEDGGVVELDSSYGVPTVSLRKSAILMQYTGLKDKNGVEIYEGDIVVAWNVSGKNNYRTESVRQVRWREMSKYTGFNIGTGPYSPRSIEVIGNVYENKELLSGENA